MLRQVSKLLLVLFLNIVLINQVSAVELCKVVLQEKVTSEENIKIALLEKPLPPELNQELANLVSNDPDLQVFLLDPTFIRYLQAIGENRPLDEIRQLVSDIWKNPELNQYGLGRKTGTLLIGPDAANHSKLLKVIQKAEIEKQKSPTDQRSRFGFLVTRIKDQLRGFRNSLANARTIIDAEMNPVVLDANLFDFYGYLNLGLDASRLREWQTPKDSFAGIKLTDIENIDPLTFTKVLMLASQIEAPIKEYSDVSGHVFHLFPQASRFMGKTQEQAEYIRKIRKREQCTNSWCEEENRHEGMLENLARRILGFVLPNSKPFSADRSLDPYNAKDVTFHVAARANNELAATSTYVVLGAHAKDNTAVYLSNIRGDELKHSTIFAGLHHYLFGSTYWARLKGVAKKMMIEAVDKNENSEYAHVLKREPITLIEFAYSQFKYERKIYQYLKLLPLKSLRKIYETDINLDPIPEVKADAISAERKESMLKLEKARREALAGWPKAQREAAYLLEHFEAKYNAEISKLITERLEEFKGAEDFGSAKSNAFNARIEGLTATDLNSAGLGSLQKFEIDILKKSLKETLRDYQIVNNRNVRKWGLHVAFIDAVKGFQVLRDEAYEGQKKATIMKPEAPVKNFKVAEVVGVQKLTDSTHILRLTKPAGFTHKPGEAVRITIETSEGPQSRFLSISTAPSLPYLEIAVRSSDSFFKETFVNLKAGDKVQLEDAKGALNFNFSLPAVMIAGGIGITPFRGIIQHIVDQKLQTPVSLIYANSSSQDIPFKQELDKSKSIQPNINVTYIVNEKTEGWNGLTGRIDKPFLASLVSSSPNNAIFYVVGPMQMVTAIKAALRELGVPNAQVSTERFIGY